jgi:hypothetical protein
MLAAKSLMFAYNAIRDIIIQIVKLLTVTLIIALEEAVEHQMYAKNVIRDMRVTIVQRWFVLNQFKTALLDAQYNLENVTYVMEDFKGTNVEKQ